MSIKFFKAAFASMVILSSTANAGVIDLDFTALDDAGSLYELAGQNRGSISVVNDILTLDTNSWFSVDLIDAIGVQKLSTPNTVLSFEFMTSATPEISGLATTEANVLSSRKSFNLSGTQRWGLDSISYKNTDSWAYFEINLGDFITSDFSQIMFINDCDNCTGKDITTSFKNMSISNPSLVTIPEPATLALFGLAILGLVSRKVKR